ncbi:hypothetical protein BDV93DRAFT_607839 [Ceratobasidium sp. AG-I]|nr:hypothetical protein BDV93DRAFT_607839 [Ceratobasidium sp. AG-I]
MSFTFTAKNKASTFQIKPLKDYDSYLDDGYAHFKQDPPPSPSRVTHMRRSNDSSPTPRRTWSKDSGPSICGSVQNMCKERPVPPQNPALRLKTQTCLPAISGPASRTPLPPSSVKGLALPSRPPLRDRTNTIPALSTPACTRNPPFQTHLPSPDSPPRAPKAKPPLKQVPLSPVPSLPHFTPAGAPQSSSPQPSVLPTPRATPIREPQNIGRDDQCQGLTQGKRQCRNPGGAGGYCHHHTSQAGVSLEERTAHARAQELVRSDNPRQCQGLTLKRVQCRRIVNGYEDFRAHCWQHVKQSLPGAPLPPASSGSGGKKRVDQDQKTAQNSTPGHLEDRKEPRTFGPSGNTKAVTKKHHKRPSCELPDSKKESAPYSDWLYEQKASPNWADFIPPDLSVEAQGKLWKKMREDPGSVQAGYIYAYEILNKNTTEHLYVKVGRSNDPIRRIKEWEKQCPSNEIVLRGVWPNRKSSWDELTPSQKDWGIPCRYYGRLERLISIELNDIACNSPHLLDGQYIKPAALESTIECPDCFKYHREIYAIGRPRRKGDLDVLDGSIVKDLKWSANPNTKIRA